MARLEIANPNKFVSDLRVFLNTERVTQLLGETEIHVSLPTGSMKNDRFQSEIIGKTRGIIGEIHFQKLGLPETNLGKESPTGPRIDSGELGVPDVISDVFGRGTEEGFGHTIFMVDVYIDQNLPEGFKHLFKSFLQSYTDVGPIWDWII